jgi:hypothetical protein
MHPLNDSVAPLPCADASQAAQLLAPCAWEVLSYALGRAEAAGVELEERAARVGGVDVGWCTCNAAQGMQTCA